ncbi:hypothetical protein TNCV_4568431 [Trichonephila clavipes]|nr:hypothetical protein TNCV_4568431 [Trichonephila clavipes]
MGRNPSKKKSTDFKFDERTDHEIDRVTTNPPYMTLPHKYSCTGIAKFAGQPSGWNHMFLQVGEAHLAADLTKRFEKYSSIRLLSNLWVTQSTELFFRFIFRSAHFDFNLKLEPVFAH